MSDAALLHGLTGARPSAGAIRRMRSLGTPGLHGEWHPETRKVFVVYHPKDGSNVAHGEELATEVGTAEEAQALFGCWIRGYQSAKAELAGTK